MSALDRKSSSITVPPLGESVSSAIIAKWYKKVGDALIENEVVLELETDKVTLEVNAPSSGVLQKINAPEGETVRIGDEVGIIESDAFTAATTPPDHGAGGAVDTFTKELADDLSDLPVKTPVPTEALVSPAARKQMAQAHLTPADVVGTGKGGRILKEDVVLRRERVVTPSPVPSFASSSPAMEERKPMTPLRRKIAERLKYAQNTAAILTTFNECDMSTVMGLRKTHQDEFVKKYGTKLGFMSFFVKACVQALKDVPAVNGEIEGDEIVYHKRYDLGIAVSVPQGLVVPVLRSADKLGLHEIEQTIAAYGEKAKINKLSMEDLTGGTFTISNGGTFGSLLSTPILNPPQSGILGMHKIQERPIAIGGQVVIRPMMYLALSYDHRIIDGREAVTFLVKVKEYIENPARILLGL